MSVGLTTLPPSCNDCLKMWEPQTLGTLMACPDLYGDCCTLTEMIIESLPTVQNTK